MKSSIVTIVGIILIIFGIATLAYKGITYTTNEKIAQIGEVQISAQSEKFIYFPPILGGLSLVVGVILVVIGKKSNK